MDPFQGQEGNSPEGVDGRVQEDRIYFGLTITHPALHYVGMDPFGEVIEDIGRRHPEKTEITWEEADKELGLECKATPTLTVNGQTIMLTPEKLKWLAIQAQATFVALKGAPALADPVWAKARRGIRGELPKK